jgi:membrane protein implicated in regulation of membrane protease activity
MIVLLIVVGSVLSITALFIIWSLVVTGKQADERIAKMFEPTGIIVVTDILPQYYVGETIIVEGSQFRILQIDGNTITVRLI